MRTADEIDVFIATKAAVNVAPGNIANSLRLPVAYVHARMDALGFEHAGSDRLAVYRVHPMWSADGYELRKAVWQRQHDGAVATLRGAL